MRALAVLTLAFCACAHASDAARPLLEVRTQSGTVAGAISGDVLSFRSIPFAAPPLRKLRWRAPQAVKPWPDVRQATAFAHDCMQTPEPSDAAPLSATPAEDCLFVNVWRPAARTAGEKLPVLLWIHGGAYVNGGTSTPIFDGSAFARHGLVFVSANYRLGRLGFFAHPALFAANEAPVGNFGLMDQIAALRWLKRNAAAFGADPDRVTLIGESAGGDSVMHLLTSPEARGLFHRAIVMSGDGRNHVMGAYPLRAGTSAELSAEQIGVHFAESVGITGAGPQALAALRALPAERVIGGLNMSSLLKSSTPVTYARGPIVDGKIVVASPGEILWRGEASRVPVMIGTTSADLPGHKPIPKDDPLAYFGADAGKARAAYDPDGTLTPLQVLLAMGADMTMHEPARFVAKQVTRTGMPAWFYRFDYVAASLRSQAAGATHFSDVPYVFDTLDARYPKAVSDKDRSIAHAFNAYVANFAKRGDPNGVGLARWPQYDAAHSALMMFTRDDGPMMQPDPWQARLDVVERAANAAYR